MADTNTIYSQQYGAALGLLAQQKPSRFASAVETMSVTGETAWYDAVGSTAAQQIVGRNGDTPNNEVTHQRTRIDLIGYDTGGMLDSIDALLTLHDPKSRYV